MTNLTYWSAEAIETIKTMFYQGETYTVIGKAVGKGRNSIGGVIFRLRESGQMARAEPRQYVPRKQLLHKKPTVAPTKQVKAKPVKTVSVAPLNPARHISSFKFGYRPRREPKVDISPPVSQHCLLMARKGCAFPINNGAPFLFCNAALDSASPYCPHHRQRMYVREKAA